MAGKSGGGQSQAMSTSFSSGRGAGRDGVVSGSGSTKAGRRRGGDGGWAGFGGYRAAKKQKLDDQFNRSSELSSCIFDGVAIYVNGYTKPSSDELRRMIMHHGGRYEQYLMKTHVTHIIATNLPNSKIRDLRDMKVVRPEWIVDSIKAGRLLSHAAYKLYYCQGNSLASFSTVLTRSTSVLSSETSESEPRNESIYLNTASGNGLPYPEELETVDEDISAEMLEEFENDENGRSIKDSAEPSEGVSADQFSNSDLSGAWEDGRVTPPPIDEAVVLSSVTRRSSRSSVQSQNGVNNNSSAKVNNSATKGSNLKTRRSSSTTQASNLASTENSLASKHINSTSNNSTNKDSVSATTGSTSAAKESNSTAGAQQNKSPAKAFLSEFYANSRLHHLSTWGAEFKAYVNKLQKESSGCFPGLDRLQQYHVDKMLERGLGETLESAKRGKPPRVIMHVDMDCFFVSVGLLTHPEARGKPVAVTHSRGKGLSLSEPIPGSDFAFEKSQWRRHQENAGRKGKIILTDAAATIDDLEDADLAALAEPHMELDFLIPPGSTGKETFHSMAEIASCSYEARQAGVKNGMFMGKARELCPDLVTIPYDFEGYNRVSKILYDTVASYTHDIEAVSCDEMLVDCTDLLTNTGATPLEFAELLRKEIAEKTGCTASAGLGGSILLARLATRRAKPNGQFHLQQADVLDFIRDQSVKDLPGVGWSMTKKLSNMGIEMCGELQKISLQMLQKEFGPKTGQSLYRFCRGEDERPIRTEKERKSVSAEVNYGIRFQKEEEAVKFVEELAGEVSTRLKAIGMKGRTMTLKLMVRRPDAPVETAKFMGHGICNSLSKSTTLPMATDEAGLLAKEALLLLKAMKADAADLRGIGIQMQRLESVNFGSGVRSAVARGNQSILNFAVARSQNSEISSDKEKTQDPPISSSSGLAQDKEGDCENAAQEMDEQELPPLPELPALSLRRRSPRRLSETSRERSQCFLSPSQVDRKVLEELPPDIRRQIEQEMMVGERSRSRTSASDRAPRKRRVDSNEPGCSHWVTPDDSSSDASQGEATRTEREGTAELSFSQIDPDVFDELPKDIQDQLKQEMSEARTHHTRSHKNSTELRRPSTEIRSGGKERDTRSWSSNESRSREERFSSSLPNLSQVDPSFMEALPADLQSEIRAAFSRKEPSPHSHNSPLGSPTKRHPSGPGCSRGWGRGRGRGRGRARGRGSPVFKVPQGRPVASRWKDFSPPKLDFGSRLEEAAGRENQPSQSPSSPPKTEAESKAVNLCGAVTLAEVRTLLSEWLESSPAPQADDVEVLVTYLGELVMDKNLEQVDLVLRYLHRKIVKHHKPSWKESFETIVSHTQDVVKSAYGSMLKTDWMLKVH